MKGYKPPGVGGGGTNEYDNEKDKSIGREQGDKASKGVAVDRGPFRPSAQHHSDTTFS